ncbi:gallate 1-beta-glucosyltransferase-like [Phragmites australis]|uniref:gallate 1-beta-glucosyltransferase-like n=1 Tax=Phragmites australis TaxID=29695 RepID=UPI002D791DA6|nr:gallate 1-beta-glucosyltransferase-like [Phragmites australis]
MSQEPAAAAAMTLPPAQPRPHVLLVAAPFQSHVNPLLRFGRRLAAKGLLVTFTTALHAGIRLCPGDGDDAGAGRGSLRVELLRGGGMWAPDDPRFRVAVEMARHVEAAGPAALEELVRRETEAGRPVTCVVANAFVPWALRVAGEMGLPCGMLWIQSCALLSVYYHHVHALAAFPEADEPGSVTLTGLPELEADELRPLLIYPSGQDLWRQMLVADLGSARERMSWVFVNTFNELEHAAVEGLREHLPVKPVGPLLEPDDADNGESSTAAGDDGYAAWLHAHPPRSVVFVAFGSLVNNESDEVTEIAAGLARTGHPFLWVVRDNNRALLSADALDALAAACGRGGKVVPWCAQGRVLAHGAVGCFVTHCGWNSTAEALAAGVPVVVSPRWSDQHINARFLVDVHRVGVRAPAPLTKDALHERVEEVMSGPEAEAMALRAARWKEKARAAVCDGGSSDCDVQAFVDQISLAGAGR